MFLSATSLLMGTNVGHSFAGNCDFYVSVSPFMSSSDSNDYNNVNNMTRSSVVVVVCSIAGEVS